MSFAAKYLRLLPAVVVVGTGLLAIKGVDLARAAQAPRYDEPDNSASPRATRAVPRSTISPATTAPAAARPKSTCSPA